MTSITDPNAEEELQQARLIRAKDLRSPNVKKWAITGLKEQESQKVLQKKTDVEKALRRELAPGLKSQMDIIKKKAFEQAHKEGYEVGYQKGIELGKVDAYDETIALAKTELEPLTARLESMLAMLQSPYQQIDQSVFQSFSNLSINIAEAWIKDVIREDETWVVSAVKDAVALLPEESVPLTIELHPDDIALIEKYAQEFSQDWKVVASIDIGVGACRVKQNYSIVENDWQTQLSHFFVDIRSRYKAINMPKAVEPEDDTPLPIEGASIPAGEEGEPEPEPLSDEPSATPPADGTVSG